ncbi:hypothetical protein [Niallia sp. Krafla_26]|uniref:hypothetical protein n=1 Tax=Niallia sp. Krafla_26 TaxID=3064703 RepID=UPI003D17AA00
MRKYREYGLVGILHTLGKERSRLKDDFIWRGNELKQSSKRKLIFIGIILIFIIAAILDIKYQGLFYQLLPNSVQSSLAEFF